MVDEGVGAADEVGQEEAGEVGRPEEVAVDAAAVEEEGVGIADHANT